jgi:hypothetical protein
MCRVLLCAQFNGRRENAVNLTDLLLADPNVAESFKKVFATVGRPTLEEKLAAKREEIEADARGEDLWLARGGSPE